MADLLDGDGLQLQSLTDIITDLENGFKAIYGSDINIEANSPDGQMINLFAQACIDIRELVQSVYNSFNPDRAIGTVLDERVAINNITRNAGSYTIQPVDIVVDRTIEFEGLDSDSTEIDGTGYTVQDDAGNQFILIDSVTLTAGSYTKNFRAKEIGLVETTTGTITNPVTVILGVTSIDNTSGALSVGEDEETDSALRIRRQYSVALSATGYLNGLLGDLLSIDSVTEAKVYENITNTTDANGIPAHSIWAIIEGGATADIGQIIYENKSYGCGMKGAVEEDITTPSGDTFTAKFDRSLAKDLHIKFDIQTTISGTVFDQDGIKTYLEDNLSYGIGDYAETSYITGVARDAIIAGGGGGVAINMEVSDDGSTWVDFLEVDVLNEQWTVATADITITEL